MDLSLPEPDEIELSVFGRGYGEAICVHMGDGQWAVFDSCINPETGSPAALSYFQSLQLDASDVVQLIVATHWDDDHIRGIGEIVEQCVKARVSCSAALRRQEIIAFVVEQEAAQGALGSGVDEFRKLLRQCSERGQAIIWAKANVPLHPLPPGDQPIVISLSPSEDAFERSIESLVEAATQAKVSVPRRYRAPEGPNGASIAASIRSKGITMLLGADLETSTNTETGWDGVLKYSLPSTKASIVKVPHHGSDDSHHDGIWSSLCEPDPIGVLTPWTRGKHYLPSQEDLNRLRSHCDQLYLTATPSLKRASKDHELERMIRRLHGDQITELRGWGHVRARRRAGETSWRVDLNGDAIAVVA